MQGSNAPMECLPVCDSPAGQGVSAHANATVVQSPDAARRATMPNSAPQGATVAVRFEGVPGEGCFLQQSASPGFAHTPGVVNLLGALTQEHSFGLMPASGMLDVMLALPGLDPRENERLVYYQAVFEEPGGRRRFRTPETVAIHRALDCIGTGFCAGDGSSGPCPCGNESPSANEGCRHSTGVGMGIFASGTPSITNDDFVLTAARCPPSHSGLFYSGTQAQAPLPLYDGLQCVGGSVLRYRGAFQSTGIATDDGFIAQDPSGAYFQPGSTLHWQYWTRDHATGSSPCGTFANFSAAISITLEP